jgi:hypothetical protein
MSVMGRAIARWLAPAREDVEEQAILADLSLCTVDRGERLHRLRQAVLIAQMGGVDDRTLEALLHLAAAGQMTPGVERHLHEVGIDTTPWAEIREQVMRESLCNPMSGAEGSRA